MATNNLYFDPCDGYYQGETGPRMAFFNGTFFASGGYQGRPYIGGSAILQKAIPLPATQAVVGARMFPNSAGAPQLFFSDPFGFDTSDHVASAGFTALGIPFVQLPSTSAVLGTDGFVLVPGVYYYLVFVASIAYNLIANTTAISCALYVDGTQRVTTSGTFSGKLSNGLFYGCSISISSGKIQDVYMSGETSVVGSPWFDLVVVSAGPTADGALLQWTPTPGGTHFPILDDVPADPTKFITDAGVGTQDDHIYGISLPANTGIVGVQFTSLHEQTDAGVAQMQHEYRVGGVNFDGNLFTLPEGYVYGDSAWLQNPATAAAWLAADLVGPEEWGELRTF